MGTLSALTVTSMVRQLVLHRRIRMGMGTQRLHIVTATAIVSAPQRPIRTAMVTQLRLIVTAMTTLQERQKAIRIAMATPRQRIRIHTVGALVHQIVIGTATATLRPHTATFMGKASVRHRAILIHLAIPLPNSAATTPIRLSGRGNFNKHEIK